MNKMKKEVMYNPELARMVADITGDGHLQIQGWRYLASYVSNQLSEIESFERRSQELFNITPKR